MPGRKSKSIRKSNKNKKRITRRKVRSVKRCKRCGRLIGGANSVNVGDTVTFTIKNAKGIMSTNVKQKPSTPERYKDHQKTGTIELGNTETEIKIKVDGCGDILTIPKSQINNGNVEITKSKKIN